MYKKRAWGRFLSPMLNLIAKSYALVEFLRIDHLLLVEEETPYIQSKEHVRNVFPLLLRY